MFMRFRCHHNGYFDVLPVHVKTEIAGPKRESWQPRHGWVYTYGEEGDPVAPERIPPMHRDVAKARVEAKLMPGEIGHMGGPEQWHWMKGGDEGGIVTEYATYHDGDALRFTLTDIKF